MRLFHLIFSSMLLLLSCGDSINITGITETQETGPEPVGNIDDDDWCSNSEEGWALLPAYPNPTNGQVSIEFQINRRFWVKMQIINKDKKVVRLLIDDKIQNGEDAKRAPGVYKVIWDARDDKGNRVKNGFYRVEFFLDGEFKCHGDIQIKS